MARVQPPVRPAKPSAISQNRRSELLVAALNVIGAECSLDVTVARIAARAGVSSALAHHYFGSKEDLFFAVQRQLLSQFGSDVIARLSRARTPRARLSAIVEASFSALQFRSETVAAWTIFYVKAQSSPANARLLHIYISRLRSNLVAELRALIPPDEIDEAAESIGSMIDGFYLRQGLRRAKADRRQAVRMTERHIDMLIAAPHGPCRTSPEP